jgi:AcrR family transcriptional regulator
MAPAERRRQLIAIGIRKLVERPIQELSIDEVAAEAGISRGLLFHYFPTKTDYYLEVLHAVRRRILRNLSPDKTASGSVAVQQIIERFIRQIDRRRDTYVALIMGQSPYAARNSDTTPAESVRGGITDLVLIAMQMSDDEDARTVRAWVAFVEELTLQWTAVPKKARPVPVDRLVSKCHRALLAVLAIDAEATKAVPST